MRNLITYFLLCLALSSCVVIEFTNPQPTNTKPLNQFPEDMLGVYLVEVINDTDKKSDTITIASNQYHSTSDNNTFYLSDTIILKPYKKDYFFNYREKDNWTVVFIKQEGMILNIYSMFSETEHEGEYISNIKSITAVEKINNEDKHEKSYIINPSKSELKKLVKKDLFKHVYRLKKIEN